MCYLEQDGGNGLLRVGVIGCGWAARTLHVPGIRASGVALIVGASDPMLHAAESLGARQCWTDWRRMLEELDCDAVLIASHPEEHAEAAVAALKAGRHVLVEKPVASNIEDAERIREAAQKAGRVLAVGFNQRCHPSFRELRRRIAAGELGELRSIRVRWSSSAGLGARGWLGYRARGGGALMDLGSHVVDLWRFLSGDELERVEASSISVLIDDETAALKAWGRSGAVMSAELSLIGRDFYEVEVECSRNRVPIRPYGSGFRRSHAEQWRIFAAAVNGQNAPAARVEDGIVSLRLISEAAAGLPLRSAEARLPVQFPISVIASTTHGFEALRTTVAHLRRQTIVGRIELIMVGPTEESLTAPECELSGFGAVKLIGAGPSRSIAYSNAAGVMRARGRIVALTEDHCFPDSGWAEALVRAHERECTAVGPMVYNANPGSAVSEADFAIGYGPWMAPLDAREMRFLPGHNSSYKRDDLLELGGRLERLLESETVLHMEWSSQGRRLVVEPGATVRHANYSLWRSWIPVQVLAGRLFGGVRSMTWPRRRRLFYAAASPLIPVVRFWRCAVEYTRPGRNLRRLAWAAPALAIGLALDGFGQFLGYLFGPGNSMQRLSRYEFNRVEHVRPEDRTLWIPPNTNETSRRS